MKIEVGKTYNLRSGAKARIIAVDEPIDFTDTTHTIIGIVEHTYGGSTKRSIATWDRTGCYDVKPSPYESGLDIIDEYIKPIEQVIYVALYLGEIYVAYDTLNQAKSSKIVGDPIAIKRLVMKEGEFDV